MSLQLLQQLLLLVAMLLLCCCCSVYCFVGRCDEGEILIESSSSSRNSSSTCTDTDGTCGSSSSSSKRQFLTSPGWPRSYEEGVRCRYKFVAAVGEKVRVDFIEFNVEGLESTDFSCTKDFLDIYVELRHPNDSLAKSPLLGRFCGHSLNSVPNTVVSLHSVLVLDFYSAANTQRVYNGAATLPKLGFNARYAFVSTAAYAPGIPVKGDGSGCRFLIETSGEGTDRSGVVQSPTFPGMHPELLRCEYIFRGSLGQRVQLQFEQFDLHAMPADALDETVLDACPVDSVRFYDADTRRRQIRSDFCGERRGLKIVSSGSSLLLQFSTGIGRFARAAAADSGWGLSELQRSGFRLLFNISSGFVRLPVQLQRVHLAGTECDFLIRSTGKSYNSLQIPKLPGGKLCRLLLQGVHSLLRSELVELQVEHFVRKRPSVACSKQSGLLQIYSSGQSPTSAANAEFCQITDAAFADRSLLSSTGPQAFIVFSTEHLPHWQSVPQFTVRYRFVTDFGIPGQPITEDSCEFDYSGSAGFTNSPFFNAHQRSHYPPNITCLYRFRPDSGQRVRLQFTHFYLEDFFVEQLSGEKRHHSVGSYVPCASDKVELFEGFLEGDGRQSEQLVATYCGTAIPGPYVTQRGAVYLLVRFVSAAVKWQHSDYGSRTATGFKLVFDFPDFGPTTSCGANVTSNFHGGVIRVTGDSSSSPYSPDTICDWIITPTVPLAQFFIQFPEFHLEGSAMGCSNAVLRLYRGSSRVPNSELCGADNSIPAFHSAGSAFVRAQLITSAASKGGKGFIMTWTELLPLQDDTGTCPGFLCQRSGHCIDHRLECNGYSNCGSLVKREVAQFSEEHLRWRNYSEFALDSSDESVLSEKCQSQLAKSQGEIDSGKQLLHVGIGVTATLLLLAAAVAAVLLRERRRSIKRPPPPPPPPPAAAAGSRHRLNDDSIGMQTVTPKRFMASSSASSSRLNGFHVVGKSNATLVREHMQKISIV